MHFDLTDEQRDIIKAAREFAEKEFLDLPMSAIGRKGHQNISGKRLAVLVLWESSSPKLTAEQDWAAWNICLINEEFWRVDPYHAQN